LSPQSATAGSAAFTLSVSGANFCAQSTVQWSGTALTTTFNSSTALSAAVPANLIAAPGSAPVRVVNPSATGCAVGVSNTFTFAIDPPGPSISSLTPPTVSAGSGGFNLSVGGAYFCAGSTVQWNGSALQTTFGNGTLLTAAVPATLVAAEGSANIRVV